MLLGCSRCTREEEFVSLVVQGWSFAVFGSLEAIQTVTSLMFRCFEHILCASVPDIRLTLEIAPFQKLEEPRYQSGS